MIGKIEKLVYYIIIGVMALILMASLVLCTNVKMLIAAILIVVIGIGVWIFLKKKKLLQSQQNEVCEKYGLVKLVVICLVFKSVVLLLNATPVADYLTYYNYGNALCETDGVLQFNPLYIALFTHVFAYPELLSFIFGIFGNQLYIVVVLNIIVSTVSVIFVYLIGKELFSLKAAKVISVMWIIFPSETLWNALCMPEPLYTLLYLVVVYACIRFHKADKNWKNIAIFALVTGFVLASYNSLRPIGIIVIVAFVISELIVNLHSVNRYTITGIIGFVVIFFALSNMYSNHIEKKVGTKLAGFTWYNIGVGFDKDTQGLFSEMRFQRLLQNVNELAQTSKTPAVDAQNLEKEYLLEDIKKYNSVVDILKLYKNKTLVLLGDDHTAVEHLQASSIQFLYGVDVKLKNLCDIFYYFMEIMVLIYILGMFKSGRTESGVVFIILLTVGFELSHILLTEVQGRYHYVMIVNYLLMVGGSCRLFESLEQMK